MTDPSLVSQVNLAGLQRASSHGVRLDGSWEDSDHRGAFTSLSTGFDPGKLTTQHGGHGGSSSATVPLVGDVNGRTNNGARMAHLNYFTQSLARSLTWRGRLGLARALRSTGEAGKMCGYVWSIFACSVPLVANSFVAVRVRPNIRDLPKW